SSLTSVTIPNSVTSIEKYAFSECSSLTSVTLPSSLSYLGADVFKVCPLKEVRIPKTIHCSGLNPTFLTLSSTDINVTSISFRLWQSSIVKIIDESGKEVSLKEAAEIDNRYKYSWDGNTVTFTELHPTQRVSFNVLGSNVSGTTNNVSISMSQVEKFADFAVVEASFGYEKFVEEYYFYMSVGGTKYKQKKISIPYEEGYGKKLTFCIKGDGFINSNDLSLSYPTPAFSDEDAVATSYTKARLTAKCNLSTGAVAGIEWRRHDAPDNVKSNTEQCPVVNGMLMGELRGLKDDVYYKFRPFYELGSTIYYGEWTGFYTGDAGVYFEPEVGTLPATVTSNSVLFEGYAFAGTDDIDESGIEYRRVGAAPKSAQASLKADGEWIKVSASSTTFFKVDLDNLAYESEYEYRSYAVADNKTYYGATASFITEADQSGVENIFATEAEGRTLSLRHNPVQGYPQLIVSGNGELVDCFIHSTTGMLMKSCSVIADGTPQEIEVNLLPGMYIVTVTDNASRSSIRMLAR
ncbi:MAG: leucine-rich repeat domain-containing protein, partial [Muribaculaceae bacterium]|nr:leucine-rich repeat domain-containing protein [Muribaculaceae bacterium]